MSMQVRHLVLCVPNMARRQENTNRLFTLGTLHLAAAAREAGWRSSIVDAYFDDLDVEATCRRVRALGPATAIGFTINATPMLDEARRLLDALPEIPIAVVGGVEASARPEAVLDLPRVVAVVRGEGEDTLCDVLAWLDHGRPPRSIPGAHLRGLDGVIAAGPRRGPRSQLDAALDIAALPMSLRPEEHSIVTSRGCSARCNFCIIGPHWSRYGQWRGSSAEWIAAELDRRATLGATHVNFVDDQFVGPPESIERAWALVRLLRERRVVLPFVFMCRADTVCEHPTLFAALRDVGLRNVFLGLESGTPSVLQTLRKDARVRDATRAVSILNGHGIGVAAGTIIFHPWTTARTLRRDLTFFGELLERFDRFHFYGLNELDVFHSTPLAARLGLRDASSWRQRWSFADPLAARVHQHWLRVSALVLQPLLAEANVERRLSARRAVNRFMLDVLADVIAGCENSSPDAAFSFTQRAHMRACQLLLQLEGPLAVRRMLGAPRHVEVVSERCFD